MAIATETKVVTQWFGCPRCRTTGWVPKGPGLPVPKVLQGVRREDHAICPLCKGWGRVTLEQIPEKQSVWPIEQCSVCKNYYAVGAGRPADEPCYQDHDSIGNAHAHCHWHDLSVKKPPK